MNEIDRFDGFLSAVVRAGGAADFAGLDLDPGLVETVRRVASLADAPPPPAAFARRLRADLARQADLAAAAESSPSARRASERGLAPPWAAQLPDVTPRRFPVLARLATALLLIATLLGGLLVIRPSGHRAAGPGGRLATPIAAPLIPAVAREPLLEVGLAGWDWGAMTASDVRAGDRIDLLRLTLAPGASPFRDLPGAGLGTRIDYVESGLFEVTLDSAGGRLRTALGGESAVAAGSPVRLGPGDALVVPGGALRTIGNAGQMPASLIEVSQGAVIPFVRLVAGLHPGELPPAALAVRLERVVLAPGASLPPPSAGTRALVHVESGVVVMTRTGAGLGAIAGRPFTYRDGGSLTVISDPSVATDLRNAGNAPAVLLVVTFAPA